MNKIRKYLSLAMLTLTMVLMACGTALAITGSYNLGNSNPAWISTSTKGVWSSAGYWDTRNNAGIPSNATVTGMEVTWSVTPTTGWSGMHVSLFNGSGSSAAITYSGATTHAFDGQSAKQNWYSKFYVDSTTSTVMVAPKLTIYYQTP